MSAPEAPEADQNVQQSDGQADAGIVLGGDTPSEGAEPQQGADTEQQTAQATPEGEAAPEAPALPEVPESYEFDAPEGVKISEPVTEAVGAIAKEHKLSQEQANGMFQTTVKALQEDLRSQFAAQQQAWKQELRDDLELGGDNLQTTIQRSKEALNAMDKAVPGLGGKFADLLDTYGLGNNRTVQAALNWLSKATAADEIVVGNVGEQGAPSAKAHFPNSPELGE